MKAPASEAMMPALHQAVESVMQLVPLAPTDKRGCIANIRDIGETFDCK